MRRELVNVLALLVGLILGGLSVGAWANEYPASVRYAYASHLEDSLSELAEVVCSEFTSSINYPMLGDWGMGTQGGPKSWPGTSNQANLWCTSGYQGDASDVRWVFVGIVTRSWYCPYGGQVSGTGNDRMCINPPACPDGQSRDPVTGQCNSCGGLSGQSAGVYEWFTGWGVSGGVSDGSGGQPPSSACFGGCVANRGQLDECYTYLSNSSKFFCSFEYIYSGGMCSDPPMSNNAPDRACPAGYTYGSVNGQFGCYPTDPESPDAPAKPGVPPGPGGGEPQPGDQPGDGAGSGDGPDGSGPGSGGGTAPGGGEFDCPDCAKEGTLQEIRDTTGQIKDWLTEDLPETDGWLQDQLDELEDAADARGEQIEKIAGEDKVDDLGFEWTPQGVLPQGGCSPLVLNFAGTSSSTDWCGKLSEWRDIWGWFLGMLAALFIWRRGHAAMSGGK